MRIEEPSTVADLFSDEPFPIRLLRRFRTWVSSLSRQQQFFVNCVLVATTGAVGEFVTRYFGSSHPDVWTLAFIAFIYFVYIFLSHYFGHMLSDNNTVTISTDNNEVMAGYFEARNAAAKETR